MLRSLAITLLIIFCLAFITDQIRAQGETVDSIIQMDTLLFEKADVFQNVAAVNDSVNYENRMYQKPMVALVKSMVIPGLGQLGNRKPVKALIFAGFDAWFISEALKYKKDARDFREQWENETDLEKRKIYYDEWDDNKTQRNKYTWFAVITAFISMFDAYVDAHLSGFPSIDKADKLSIEVQPNREGDLLATVSFSF